MRWLLCFALLFLAPAQMAMAEVDSQDELFDEAEHTARMLELIETLIESPDPTRQAAGLLMVEHAGWAGWYTEEPLRSGVEVLDQLYALIDQADTPLARTLLAQLCAATSIQSACVRRGLDEAILRLDGGNLIARLMLIETGDHDRIRDVVIAAESINEHHMDLALLLLDAMEAQGVFSREEMTTAPMIYGLLIIPPFQHFTRLCTEPAANDTDLNQACDRITHKMTDNTGSLILTMIGASITARRLAAEGATDALEKHEEWRAAHREWLTCVGSAGEKVREEADEQFTRELIEHWQRHGEASAQALLAEKAGLDCEPLESPVVYRPENN